jgi:hypothetical protein
MTNEKRLIDANELEQRLVSASEYRKKNMNCFGALVIDEIIAVELANAPTVDAVEVVRCKDCMWFDTDDELADVFHKERHCFCTDVNTYVSENGFCSCGERKDND